MPGKLKIAALSQNIMPGDIQSNLNYLETALGRLEKDTDLIILPELFSTGYTSNADVLAAMAESNGGDTVASLHRLSRNSGVAIAGSFLAKTGHSLSNRAFFIEPSGDEIFYDKRHLFSMSSESALLTQGQSPLPIVRYRGWNLALSVCYDLRFPVWCRNNGLRYDALIVVANWPDARRYAWEHLLIARAIENQAYVIGVDRSGEDKFGKYDGMTFAVDFCGKRLADMSLYDRKDLSCFMFDHDQLDHWRKDFTPWKDADLFNIEF